MNIGRTVTGNWCDEIPHQTAPNHTGPPKLGEGSPQPGKTMGSPGTLPLMGGHP